MRSAFNVLFYLKKNALKKDGVVPVMCRIITNCALQRSVGNVTYCKTSKATVLQGKSFFAMIPTRFFDKIRVGINVKYREIAERNNYFTVEKEKKALLELEMRHATLLKVYDLA